MSPQPETSGDPPSRGRTGHDAGSAPCAQSAADASPEAGNGEQESAEAFEEDLETALALARRERDEYLEMVQRLQADFENYKKRMLRQQTELLERAAEGLVLKLLPALDAFDLARLHLGDVEESSPEGKALAQASALLFDTLAKEGLERLDDTGVPFDPTTHDAVEHEAADQTAAQDDGAHEEVGEGAAAGASGEAAETGSGPPGASAADVAEEVVAGGPVGQETSGVLGGSGTRGKTRPAGDGTVSGPVVVAVLRAGYRWKGRVIRPPMVRVRG
jgi:molecular chaperone GrpE